MQDTYKDFISEEDDENEYGAFNKTHIVVDLIRHKGDGLISRSQAKRIMARTERFKKVILDFEGIDYVSQGFADEIFRVFPNAHPKIKIEQINISSDVEKMRTYVLKG